MLQHMLMVTNRSGVGLSERYITKLFASNLCSYTRIRDSWLNVFPYFRKDPRASEVIRVVIASAFLPDWVRKEVTRRITRIVEAQSFESFFLKSFEFFLQSPAGRAGQVEECMTNRIIMPDHPPSSAVPLLHFQDLLCLTVIAVAVAVVVMLAEVGHSCGQQRKVADSSQLLSSARDDCSAVTLSACVRQHALKAEARGCLEQTARLQNQTRFPVDTSSTFVT